jgi:hypothetical protein
MKVAIVSPKGKPTEILGVVEIPDHMTAEEAVREACTAEGDRFEDVEFVACSTYKLEPR